MVGGARGRRGRRARRVAATRPRDRRRTTPRRPCSRSAVALLVAIGLHLALGLARGTLEHRLRRGIVIAGYVGAIGARGVALRASGPTFRSRRS